MRTTRHEHAAVARAVPAPRVTRAEAETQALIAEWDALAVAVAQIPREVQMERAAAVLAHCVTPADAEAVRAAFWLRLPLPARMVVVMSARLPKERANDALSTFDAFERGTMWRTIEALQGNLAVAQKCMNGGRLPTPVGVQ
jgi:hypothetical protein